MTKLLRLAIVLGLFLCWPMPAHADSVAPPPAAPARAVAVASVYYAGPDNGVLQALRLGGFRLVANPADAQALVLNGEAPDPPALAALVRGGTGLVLIMGRGIHTGDVSTLLDADVLLSEKSDASTLEEVRVPRDWRIDDVQWNSAPQVRGRFIVKSQALSPLVISYGTADSLLAKAQNGAGKIYLFSPRMEDDANPQIQQWAYFNYLIYHLTARVAGVTPLGFADYPNSPVPHPGDRSVLLLIMAALVTTSFVVFAIVRRYSLAHPESLNRIIANRARYATHEAHTDWENIGFHRPLGGFLLAMMLGLVLFVPLIVYQNLILPAYILPSAQALGIWDRVVQFFNVLWLFFDMGTSTAFIKFLAQYRVDDPRQGIKFGQLFLWWQVLSGSLQVALVIAVASTLLPRSAYALYAWSIIIHSLIQVPGFYQVYRHSLYGFQRFDYAQVIEIGISAFFPIMVQPLVVVLMYRWGNTQPVFGAATGGLLGMGIAAYISELLTFAAGWWLYRRLGYSSRVLFLAHFDWPVIKQAFRFGIFEMLGSIAWGLGQAVEVWITQVRLLNYAEVWGNWRLAQNFVYAFQISQTLTGNLMPAISEAISKGRTLLGQYYVAQGYKWGGTVSAFIAAVLLAVADRFILGASGPEFARAAIYAGPLILWGAIQFPSWVADNVQRGANKPYLLTLLVAGEQALRITLAWLLLARFQVNALIIAYFAGLLAKDLAGYAINHRVCFPQRFYVWQSLVAPALAGVVHYAFVRWVGGILWHSNPVSSVLILLIGILPSYPAYAFFCALFGGWDDETLAELKRAVPLSGFMRPMSWLYWAASDLGSRISPLHNRFPITIRQDALAEAGALTAERVEL